MREIIKKSIAFLILLSTFTLLLVGCRQKEKTYTIIKDNRSIMEDIINIYSVDAPIDACSHLTIEETEQYYEYYITSALCRWDKNSDQIIYLSKVTVDGTTVTMYAHFSYEGNEMEINETYENAKIIFIDNYLMEYVWK